MSHDRNLTNALIVILFVLSRLSKDFLLSSETFWCQDYVETMLKNNSFTGYFCCNPFKVEISENFFCFF